MKRKILVPMFASVMALSMNTVANADQVENNNENDKNSDRTLDLGEYQETTYKTAVVKDGVAVKIRNSGDVKTVAYTGDEFKVIGTQGEWVKVSLEDGEGWLATRYVDIKESIGYVTGEKVNFRKEANTESEVIKELEIGSTVKVLEANENWLKVKKGEDEGYIRALYVSEEAPNTESEVIKELEIGSTVKVLEANENWLKVKKGEDEGYIRALYVSEEAPVIEVEEPVVVNETQTSNTQSNRTQSSTSSSNSSSSNNSTNSSNGQAQKPAQNNNSSYNPPASSTSSVQAVLNLAYSKIGCPYVWGAEGPNSFDCSGFTSYVFRNAAPASSTSSVQAVLNLAYSKIGCPYVWGAEGPNSFDCSGFTSYVFRNAAGVSLPRTSSAQSGYGRTVSKSNLQPGDLVFFNTSGKGVSHVGIYVGGGNMIHSPSSGKTVSVTSINSSYYSARFVTAKRVL